MATPRLLIFGAGEYAEVAHYYFTHDAGRDVAALVVDDAYAAASRSSVAPIVAWSEALTAFPPANHDMFVAIGYSKLNRLRAEKAATVSQAGYALTSFLHSRAVVWQGFELQSNCLILEHNTLQPFTTVGPNVVLWSGNHIGHHSTVEHGCFISSHVVIAGGVRVGAESFVGINCTVREHITIGRRNVLGAGSLILENTPDDAVFAAEPTVISRVPSHRLRRL
jgi:sugar O-acyltransferase (sialic acid O-acetyltransferase NeuD family)